jgi:AraC-like DNA-binding protein
MACGNLENAGGRPTECEESTMIDRLTRLPRPALRPFIQALWAIDEAGHVRRRASGREHVVPTGAMHLVFRLSDDPLRLFEDADDREGQVVSTAVVGGARARFYIRDVSKPLCSVGAQLRPGAATLLFGVHAGELAERHTPLEDLWGGRVASMRDRLGEAPSLEQRLDLFEELLAERLPLVRGLHPAVAQALQQLAAAANVHDVVKRSGYSHRRFIELFVHAVGLTPKVYSRVRRFQRALHRARVPGPESWADVAAAAGYSDQSHFTREFRECVGITPTRYRDAAPRLAHHVPVDRR